eukprot:TRINITY_DN1563_c0_g1_i1.p1 TRINITY_DN1563_c0_g1~~TRINITY_DN1563_c0_g1_i1.p1  ORF type:complete len:460 (+),score=120.86 TRINITY_DN1563_c0_g1_i1:226-1605(+)
MDSSQLDLPSPKAEAIRACLSGFHLSTDQVQKLQSIFHKKLELGMERGLDGSCIQMENTFVPELPNGKEEGLYMAMDLGSSNFRIILLQMTAGKIVREEIEPYAIPEERRYGSGPELFEFLGECCSKFLTDHLPKGHKENIPLGFSFSFPMRQNALDSGILVTWTSRFNCSESVGRDAVSLLRDALRKFPNTRCISVNAILNDTTGTLVRGAYDDPETAIGLIVGTGSNGAYLEKGERVLRWAQGDKTDEVIMDPEWGAFGDDGCIDFIKTEFDREIDASSLIPKSFTYEKYYSGNFIGDLLRLVLLDLAKKGYIFGGKSAESVLNNPCLEAKDISTILGKDNLKGTEEMLKRIGLYEESRFKEDFKIMEYVSEVLSERSALLVVIPLAEFLERMDRSSTTIAVTGSLYKYHPKLKAYMEKYLKRLAPKHPFKFHLSDDGSGKGAGLIAAIAHRLSKES